MGGEVTDRKYQTAVAGWVLERGREANIKGEEEINTMNEVYRNFKNIVGNIDRTEEEIRNATNSIDIDLGDFEIGEEKEPINDAKIVEKIEDNER